MTKMKNALKLTIVAASLIVAGCSSDDSDDEEEVLGVIYGPYSTGTSSASHKVYFDLDTASVVDITDEQAATDTQWDIAFERYKVFLNSNNQDAPVAIYNTNSNAEFYGQDGAIADMFKSATADSELQDFLNVTYASIPTDVENDFVADEMENVISGWSSRLHETGIDPDNAFIVKNGDNYSKFSVTSYTYDFTTHSPSDITISNSYNFSDTTEFTLDAATECGDAEAVYVDLATGSAVASDAVHDLVLSCASGSFGWSIDLAEGLSAYPDFSNSVADASTAGIYAQYGYFKENQYEVPAFGQVAKGSFGGTFWVAYNEDYTATYYSDFNVYIVKTADKYFKLQFTSFYNEAGENGNLSLRAEELVAAE